MSRLLATKRARRLRSNQTGAEGYLWSVLRDRRLGGCKWRRQAPCGPYIVDFLCVEARLVVELDGSQHIDAKDYDDRRTAYLAAQGLQVLRFWNSFVLENRSDVCDAIAIACSDTFPLPPAGEDAQRAGEGERSEGGGAAGAESATKS